MGDGSSKVTVQQWKVDGEATGQRWLFKGGGSATTCQCFSSAVEDQGKRVTVSGAAVVDQPEQVSGGGVMMVDYQIIDSDLAGQEWSVSGGRAAVVGWQLCSGNVEVAGWQLRVVDAAVGQ